MLDQVSGIGDIMGIGSKRTKEGRHVEIKLAAVLSPSVAAQLMSLQDNGKVRFMFEPVIEQQALPGMDKPQDVPGQLKAVFDRLSTCPQCQSEMDNVAGGWRCPRCGLGVTVNGEVTSGEVAEASEDGQDDEGREETEEGESAAPAPASDGQVLCIRNYYCEWCDKLTAQNLILTSSGKGIWQCSVCGETWPARERDVQEATGDERPFRPAVGE